MSEVIQKEGERLIFDDETVIEGGRCGYSDGHLWCWVNSFTMQQAAQVFFDPQKTRHITYEYGEMSDEYDGFTNCTSLMINNDGQVSACLKRGEINV